MKFDPMQRARDFTTGKHPRRQRGAAQPLSQQLAQIKSDVADLREGGFLGGGSGSGVVDSLPDPHSSYIGQQVLVRADAGQPSTIYIGSQDALDNPVWVPQTAGDPYTITNKRAIAKAGVGSFGVASGLAVSPTSVYVSSINDQRVRRYTHEGVLVATFGPGGLLTDSPGTMAYDPVNDRVAISGNDSGSVGFQVWTSDFSTRIFQNASSGSGNGQFSGGASSIVADAAGAWYVIDAGNDRVQKFDAAGSYQLQFGGPGVGDGLFLGPTSITIDNNGDVHVLDSIPILSTSPTWPRVQKFSASGSFLLAYGHPGFGPGQLVWPVDITCTDDNYLLITDPMIVDPMTTKLLVFTTDGTFVTEFPLDKVLPAGYMPLSLDDYRGSIFLIARDRHAVGPDEVRLLRAGNATTSSVVVARNASVVSSAARILDFSDKFLVTESPVGEANIDLDYGTVAVGRNGSLVAADASVFDFSSDFTVVESPAGEVNIGRSRLEVVQDADYTGANSSAAQKVFNESANGAVTVEEGTYHLRLVARISTLGTANHSLSMLFNGGSATIASIGYKHSESQYVNGNSAGAEGSGWFSVANGSSVWAAVSTTTINAIDIEGIVRFSAGGTFLAQYKYSAAPGVAPITARNSFMRLEYLGDVNHTVRGPWS